MRTGSTLPTGVVTFLFTDIEGSTRMVQRLGDRFEDVLAGHHRILRSAIAGAGGVEVGTEGDAFFAVYPTPGAAISSALAAQRAVKAYPWGEGEMVLVRMGMHTGEARLGGDDYVGLEVNRAARIAAAAHGGQILASAATATLVARSLPDGIELRDLGTHRLKDLDEPEQIYQVDAPDLPAEFPPLRTAEIPTNLPLQTSEFVGRDVESSDVARLIGEHRLVTLTGVGGTGKTRLAIHVAGRVIDRHPGGVYFVPLDAIDDPDRVLPQMAGSLGLPTDGDTFTAIASAVGTARTLILLDNVEHVVAAAPEIGRLLGACPELRILATSQAVLRVRGEQVYPVPQLGVPGSDDPDTVRASDGGALFVRRVRSSDPSFAVNAGNAGGIAAIVRRLDGLPLAIELAAARVRLFGVDGLRAELDRGLTDLGVAYVDGPERHRTLHGAIGWSYQLLDPSEQTVFRSVSVFTGGFSLRAAAAIGPGDGRPVTTALGSLLDKSLVKSTITAGTARFTMLETIRSFGRLLLEEQGEADDRLEAHARWFLRFAAEVAAGSASEFAMVESLSVERANLLAALEWSTEHDPDPGLAAMKHLSRFFEMAGLLDVGSEIAARLLAVSGVSPEHRLTGLLGAASMHYWLLDYDRAESLYDEAIEIATDLGDTVRLAEAEYGLAFTYVWQERAGDSEEMTERAIATGARAEALGSIDPMLVLNAMALRGSTRWLRNDLAGAAEAFVEAREAAAAAGHEGLVINSEGALATLLVLTGHHLEAIPVVLYLIERSVELGDDRRLLTALDYLAGALARAEPELGMRIGGAVRATTDRRGGSIQLSSIGVPDHREVASAVLDPEDVERLWSEGRSLDVDEAVDLVRDWAARKDVRPASMDVAAVVEMVANPAPDIG